MTTTNKHDVELLAPEISQTTTQEIGANIKEEFKLIDPTISILALVLLILTFVACIIIFAEFGTIETHRGSGTEFNTPVVIVCMVHLLAAFLVFNVSSRVKNTARRVEQMEKILLEMYKAQSKK